MASAVALYVRCLRRGEPVPPEVREGYREYRRARQTPEQRKKHSEYCKHRYATNEEVRRRVHHLHLNPEEYQKWREHVNERNRERFREDPEYRERRQAYQKRPSIVYCRYKADAIKKGRTWNLTLEQVTELIQGDCRYCGRQATETDPNGIDRIDNRIGYEPTNVQSCCTRCNCMKCDLPEDAFLMHITAVFAFQSTEHVIPRSDNSLRFPCALLFSYKEMARKKGREFALDKKQAYSLFFSPCIYCGHFDDEYLNGIDRYVNDLPYTPENSVSCCKQCNKMKYTMEPDVFINHIVDIAMHCELWRSFHTQEAKIVI